MADPDPLLPEQTADDTDAGWGEPSDSAGQDDAGQDDLDRFRRERPPHHGD